MSTPRDAGRTAGKFYGNQPEDRLVDEHEAAARLGLAVATLRRWRWCGRGPVHRKLGAAVRYSSRDLTDFIEAGRRLSTSDRGPEAA